MNNKSPTTIYQKNIANTIDYYIYDIAILGFIYIGLVMINQARKKYQTIPKTNILNKEGLTNNLIIRLDGMTPEQKALRKNYLLGSLLIKAATWIKAPYLFALYNRMHGFTRQDIGILYAVDNLSSLIFGPLIGGMSDSYGNKKFCVLYGGFVSWHIYLRLTGVKFWAYFAQIITGICSCILDVSFETWFVNESSLLFTGKEKLERETYRSEVFSKQVQIDCITSIFLTGFATVLYMNYGITFPFIACSFLAIVASIFVLFFWSESPKERFIEHDKKNNVQEENDE